MISVIVAGGGRGRRMKSAIPKALLSVAGKPLLVRALEVFQKATGVGEIIVVLPGREIEAVLKKFGRELDRLGVKKVVAGGTTRQESVARGLSVVDRESKWVVVHDAARPVVSPRDLRSLFSVMRTKGAAILAVPVRETIKEVGPGGYIDRTVDRSRLWRAQTPQGFRADWLREAHRRGVERGATDDAQLLEESGRRVWIVEGGEENRKVTVGGDLSWAEEVFRRRRP